jgi:hypothetical protein
MTVIIRRLKSPKIFQWLTLGVMLSGNFLLPAAARAAESKPLNLVTSPLPISLSVAPGTNVTTDLRVKQSGPDTEKLKISLMKFGAFGTEGKPRLLDRAPGDDYFDWVRFDRTTFDAPSNVWQTIKMTINVPKSAAFGYYYAVVFSRAGDDQAPVGESQPTAAYNGGSAVLVLMDAKVPNAKREMTLDSFTSAHRVYEFLPADFDVKFKNTGNVHMVPHGNIFIMSGKKQVATLDLNDAQGNILPGSSRVYPLQWMDGFPHFEKVTEDGKVKLDKNKKPVMHLVWSNGGAGASEVTPHLRFGKYTAHLFAVYDDGARDVPMESTISFWVIPWRFLLAVLLVIVLIGAGVYAATRGALRGVRTIARRK